MLGSIIVRNLLFFVPDGAFIESSACLSAAAGQTRCLNPILLTVTFSVSSEGPPCHREFN